MRLSGSAIPYVCAFAALLPIISVTPVIVQAAAASSAVIEEVVVTSRRLSESVQDVPISVSAFTMADLERIAPRTLRDIDGLMPNVFVGQQTAGPSMGAIFIRGIGAADVEKSVVPSVGLVLDGVFQGTSTGQLIDTFDVAQIEVNRGPQGVLYGGGE